MPASKKQFHALEIAYFLGQIVLAVVGIWAVVIYHGQLTAMQGQLTEMKGSGQQTDRLLGLYQKQLAQLTREAEDTHDLVVAAGKQADAGKALADLTAKQFSASQELVESQRASITVGYSSVIAPVTFHDGSLSANFSVVLKNSGRLPATRVRIRTTFYYSLWGENVFWEPLQKQRDFCSKSNELQEWSWTHTGKRIDLKGLTNAGGFTILPGDTKESEINFGMGKPSDSQIIAWPPDQRNQTKQVYPFIVGCVDYQSGSMPTKHQTGFIFQLEKGTPDVPSFIRYGEDVPPKDVLVTQFFFGQGRSY
jgi:hypothetical protein